MPSDKQTFTTTNPFARSSPKNIQTIQSPTKSRVNELIAMFEALKSKGGIYKVSDNERM